MFSAVRRAFFMRRICDWIRKPVQFQCVFGAYAKIVLASNDFIMFYMNYIWILFLFHMSIVPKFVTSPKLYQFQMTWSCDSFASRGCFWSHANRHYWLSHKHCRFFFSKCRVMLHFLYGSGFLERMIIIHIWKSNEIYESNRFVSHLPASVLATDMIPYIYTYLFFFFFFCYFAQS